MSSRARAITMRAGSYLSSGLQLCGRALDQEPEYRPNQQALEGTYRLPPRLPVNLHPTCDIRLGRRIEAGLDHGDHIERSVQLPVTAPVETHALDLPGTRRDGSDAGQGREGVGRSEAADITYLGDEPGGGDWPRTRKTQKRMTGHEHLDATCQSLDLPLETLKAQKESASELSLDPSGTVQEPPDRRPMAGGDEVRDFPTIAWRQSEQMRMEPISCSGCLVHEVLSGFEEQPNLGRPIRQSDRWQVLLAGRDPGDRKGITRIALARPARAQAFDPA